MGLEAVILICAQLKVLDGDSIKCLPSGQNMRLLGEGIPFVSGIDTPEIGSHAKCLKERKLALLAKARLKEILAEGGLTIEFYGVRDKTPSHRPLVNIYDKRGNEVGQTLLKEGFAREWRPGHRNDWCD